MIDLFVSCNVYIWSAFADAHRDRDSEFH